MLTKSPKPRLIDNTLTTPIPEFLYSIQIFLEFGRSWVTYKQTNSLSEALFWKGRFSKLVNWLNTD